MCTIALAKVQRNYNCYNVYFYECLLLAGTIHNKSSGHNARNNMRDTGEVSRIYFLRCTK